MVVIRITEDSLMYMPNPFRRARIESPNSAIRRPSLQLEQLERREMFAVNPLFDWSMPDRFGIDTDADGLIDMHNDATFVQQELFEVTLNGRLSESDAPIDQFNWNITGPGINHPLVDANKLQDLSGDVVTVELPQGSYFVDLEVTAGGETGSIASPIEVRDILIVSIGDSLASGEGNPEIDRGYFDIVGQWADTEFGPLDATAVTPGRLAHRSSASYAAQAALEMEEADRHTSVTFVSVASSGATVQNGLTAAQTWSIAGNEGVGIPLDENGSPTGMVRASQLDQVEEIVGSRHIDALTVSIGANDVSFGTTVKDLIALPNAPQMASAATLELAQEAALERLKVLNEPDDPLDDGAYGVLAAAIENRLDPCHVFLTEYYDPTTDANGNVPLGVTPDLPSALRVDQTEGEWAQEVYVPALNEEVRKAVVTQQLQGRNWQLVDGIAEAFQTHGYPAEDERWIVTATDSVNAQGPALDPTLVTAARVALDTSAFVIGGSIGGAAGSGAGAVVGAILGGPVGAGIGSAIGSGIGATAGASGATIAVDVFFNTFILHWNQLQTRGVVHPNAKGHEAVADRLMAVMPSLQGFCSPFTQVAAPMPNNLVEIAVVPNGNLGFGHELLLQQSPHHQEFLELVVNGDALYFWNKAEVGSIKIDAGGGTLTARDLPKGFEVDVSYAQQLHLVAKTPHKDNLLLDTSSVMLNGAHYSFEDIKLMDVSLGPGDTSTTIDALPGVANFSVYRGAGNHHLTLHGNEYVDELTVGADSVVLNGVQHNLSDFESLRIAFDPRGNEEASGTVQNVTTIDAFPNVSEFEVIGSKLGDAFHVNSISNPVGSILLSAGDVGSGDLYGANRINHWNIDEQGLGRLNGTLQFKGIANLYGAETYDTFEITDSHREITAIDGRGGDDVLQVTGLAGRDEAVINVNNVQLNTRVYPFENIETLRVKLSGGGSTSTIDAFPEVDRFTLTGGLETDVFHINTTEDPIGSVTIMGLAGMDTLYASQRNNDWTVATVDNRQSLSGYDEGRLNENISFQSIDNFVGGDADDTFAFVSDGMAPVAIFGSIDGGGGSNTLDFSGEVRAATVELLSPTALNSDRVAGVVVNSDGTLTIVDGATRNITRVVGSESGNDTLVGPENSLRFQWVVDGNDSGTAGNRGAYDQVAFAGFENLEGSDGPDFFLFEAAGHLNGWIDGNGGRDRLVYAKYDQGIKVDLLGRNATGVGRAISGIEDVVGSPFDDFIRGDDQANKLHGFAHGNDIVLGLDGDDQLYGNRGRDILIGGNGSDQIAGGDGEDLLVGGTTTYDYRSSVDAAFAGIQQTWTKDHPIDARVHRVRKGVTAYVRNARGELVSNTVALNDSTVEQDSASDHLSGQSGRDWYFASLEETLEFNALEDVLA